MRIDGVYIHYSNYSGKFSGSAKIYVGDLLVEVALTEEEAKKIATVGCELTDAHERAKAIVRSASKAAA